MQKLMLYVFPIGVVVGAPFLPLAILIYWVSNNLWTLGQQYVVYRRIDAEQAEKKAQAAVNRQALAPRPGQKPVRPERADAEPAEPAAKKPGAKPVMRKQAPASTNTSTNSRRLVAETSTNGSTSGDASTNGTANNDDHGTAGAGSRRRGQPRLRAAPGSAADPADHPRPPASAAAAATPHHPRRRRTCPRRRRKARQAARTSSFVRARSPATTSRGCWTCWTSTATSTSTSRVAARWSASTAARTSTSWSAAGEVLDALQELTRLAVHQKTGERSRLMLDIAGWRRRRRDEFTEQGLRTAKGCSRAASGAHCGR